MATVEALLDQARLDLDDPKFSDSDADSRWKDAELVGYLNRAVDEACLRARLIEDTGKSPWGKISIVADKAEYEIDPRVLRIRRAKLASDTQPLSKVGYSDLDYKNSDWEVEKGDPLFYIQDFGGNKIRLAPIPSAADTLTLTVQRTQSDPLSVEELDCEPEIPVQFHYELLDYVYHLCYRRRDDDTYDPQQASDHLRAFDSKFGQRPTAEDITTIRREWPRTVRGKYF